MSVKEVYCYLFLQRLPQYYMLNIMIPTIVLSCLSLLVFGIPIDAGEKISLGITVLLSFSVFMLVLNDITPHTSENIPVISKWIII